MPEEKDKKLWPGDPGYPGEKVITRAYVNGKAVEVTTYKDAYGNVTGVYTRDLLFGIF